MTRFVLPLLYLLLLSPVGADAQTIENGKFRFYETKQIRGEENYSISRTSNGEFLSRRRRICLLPNKRKSLW
jgi:hypothetical protein